ncbi:RNA polymerase sigma factor (sigma-70 family) [Bacillus oleivorans]|uniref:RNA polymerase sigma factor (Sigma-70 family) n=1 Tax=Bacillus oleivorans TaxID=1448271 RepID=A0A285CV37_9BACI|nr:RNA polymerase sigma factor [Bacillus oleivorans]SNX71394.1 RNA polymerase sigma factor (sigma-70 family) [Bacillus oleivorans]
MKSGLVSHTPIKEESVLFQEKQDNKVLVEKARRGDQEAFSELVRRHRAKAHGWAYSVTQDSFLAEDIVQEALFRAFLKLGTLLDTNKFTPWLRQIVRNQAYMKIRNSQPYKKEQPFTSIEPSKHPSPSDIDWGDIDHILFYLSYSASEKTKKENPEEYMLRYSVIEGIRSLLHCLSLRERRIFEAYFFEDLNPIEIAKLFETSKANVYNTISRSRAKVQKERIRLCIREYVEKRSSLGQPKRKILAKPDI